MRGHLLYQVTRMHHCCFKCSEKREINSNVYTVFNFFQLILTALNFISRMEYACVYGACKLAYRDLHEIMRRFYRST